MDGTLVQCEFRYRLLVFYFYIENFKIEVILMSGKIYYKGKEYMGGEGTTTEFEELWIRDEVNNVKKGLLYRQFFL